MVIVNSVPIKFNHKKLTTFLIKRINMMPSEIIDDQKTAFPLICLIKIAVKKIPSIVP